MAGDFPRFMTMDQSAFNNGCALSSLLSAAITHNLQHYQLFLNQDTTENAAEFSAYHKACKASLSHLEMLLKLQKSYALAPDQKAASSSQELDKMLQHARRILSTHDH